MERLSQSVLLRTGQIASRENGNSCRLSSRMAGADPMTETFRFWEASGISHSRAQFVKVSRSKRKLNSFPQGSAPRRMSFQLREPFAAALSNSQEQEYAQNDLFEPRSECFGRHQGL